LEDLGIDGREIMKCILKKWDAAACTRLVWFRVGSGGGFL